MKKIISLLLIVGLCGGLLIGCTKAASVYNEKRNGDYKKVKSVNGLIFEVPEAFLEDAKSLMEIGTEDELKSDDTYYLDEVSGAYLLGNFDRFIVLAYSNIEGIDLEDVESIEDLSDMLEDSEYSDFELDKKYIKDTNKDDVIKIIADATADIDLYDNLNNEFMGKMILLKSEDITSLLFVAVTEDEISKENDKLINYVAKSLEADDFEEGLSDSTKDILGAFPGSQVSGTVDNTPAVAVEPVVTEAPEVTEAPVAPVAAVTDSNSTIGTISTDLYSFQIEIDGDVYQLPMTYESLTGNGWVYDGDSTQTLDPGQYLSYEVFKKGNIEIGANILNLGVNVEPYSNCMIGGITIDGYYNKSFTGASLPGGITFGISSKEEVIAAYGEPTDTYEDEYHTSLTYEYASYQEIEIEIDAKTMVINNIDIRNFIQPEGTSQASDVNSEVPDVVNQYKVPTSLGDDFKKFIVKFDGQLYQVPAPVSVFMENGWKIVETESDTAVAAKDYGWITLMKNNQSFRAIVNNYADYQTIMDNCFVTSVIGDINYTNVPITIQKGITNGMTKKDLEKALAGTDYEKEDSSSYSYYTIVGPNSALDCIEIYVNSDTNKVYKIEVNNSPSLDELFQ